MKVVLELLLLLSGAALAVPLLFFAWQAVGYVLERSRPDPEPTTATAAATATPPATATGPRCRLAILVPSHNEAAGIAETVRALLPELGSHDRLIVVADNCNDDTATLARQAGATVVERQDAERRGKGYALDFGMQHLRADPPDVVLVVDADCRLEPGSAARLAAMVMALGRPVQARYDMLLPDGDASPGLRVTAFAWRVKTHVRSLGLRFMRAPNQLLGTGMAFPWATLAAAELATGAIVEDLKLGVECAVAGTPAVYAPSARVISWFPSSDQAAAKQKERWERGHLGIMATFVPGLVKDALRLRRPKLLLLALDICVPPLALLAVAIVIWAMAALVIGAITWTSWLLIAGLAMPLVFAAAIFALWRAVGRDLLSGAHALAIPGYVLAKIPTYVKALLGRSGPGWVRTDRS
jgi:cellulose synthase/poly-beta-1,6-N-acetylglucosamine synthase-like glycosyltransferase